MTDRDAICAVFNAVVAIGERLTGERLTVYVETSSGERIAIAAGAALWSAKGAAEVPAVCRAE